MPMLEEILDITFNFSEKADILSSPCSAEPVRCPAVSFHCLDGKILSCTEVCDYVILMQSITESYYVYMYF